MTLPTRGRVFVVDGMRGYAACGVLINHFVAYFGSSLPAGWGKSLSFGGMGVVVFFVLSSFSICHSFAGRQFNWRNYAMRRFFRIAPAYYLVMIAVLVSGMQTYWAGHFQTPFDLYSLLFHFTFLTWLDYRHANNALGVEWTLPVEAAAYLLLPLAALFGWRALSVAMVVTLAVLLAGLPLASNPTLAYAWERAPFPYAFCFLAGVTAYKLWEQRVALPRIAVAAISISVLLFLRLSLEAGALIYALAAGGLLLSAAGSSIGRAVFANRVALWLGDHSYSIYLVHLPVATAVQPRLEGPVGAIVALTITLVLSIPLRKAELFFIERGRVLVKSSSVQGSLPKTPST